MLDVMQPVREFKSEGEFAGFIFHTNKWDIFSPETPGSKLQCEVCREESLEKYTFVCQHCDAVYCMRCMVSDAVCREDKQIHTFCSNDCLYHFVDASDQHCLLFCEGCVTFKQERDVISGMCSDCNSSLDKS